jgi:hypothetical protein
MPTEFSVDTSRRLILTRASGTLTLADIAAARRQLCADPAFDRTFNELFDLRDVTEVAISAAEFEGIAGNSVLARGVRRAFVVTSNAHLDLAHVFGKVAEAHGQRVLVFRHIDAAEAWLAAGRDP